jgi:hypothetical protein
MGASGRTKLKKATIQRVREQVRHLVNQNKDLLAAVGAEMERQRVVLGVEDTQEARKNAMAKIFGRNKFLRDAAKKIFLEEKAQE